MARDLMAALAERPLVCDGAMGTMLMASGVDASCPEEINLLSPETVRDIHAAYVAAGADVIGTNSFGGSRSKLSKVGLGDRVREVNVSAARIAREAAGDRVFVAGSMGPLGEFMEPLGDLTREQAVAIFREQAEALAEGGVDFFQVETMYDLGEATAAMEAAASTGLPVFCNMTFDTNLHTMMGVSPTQAVLELRAAGAVAVGANCGVGPTETLKAVQEMHLADGGGWLAAQPNAGVPSVDGVQASYTVSAEEMGAAARLFVEAGARLVGSCCGSTPDYTRAIVGALRGI